MTDKALLERGEASHHVLVRGKPRQDSFYALCEFVGVGCRARQHSHEMDHVVDAHHVDTCTSRRRLRAVVKRMERLVHLIERQRSQNGRCHKIHIIPLASRKHSGESPMDVHPYPHESTGRNFRSESGEESRRRGRDGTCCEVEEHARPLWRKCRR